MIGRAWVRPPVSVVWLVASLTTSLITLAMARPCLAEGQGEAPAVVSDTWKTRSVGPLALDGGLLLAIPAALPTGLSTGVGAGITRGRTWAWGARASWSTATESTLAWAVTQWDLRLRAIGALQHAVGRTTLALRLGVGATVVHETRLRNDGVRAGQTGDQLRTSATDTLPAADLELVVALHVAGPWILMMSGGPSTSLLDGNLRGGWTASTGVGWQP